MASSELEFDLRRFRRYMDVAGDVIRDGGEKGIDEALDLWQVAATNLAPIGRYPGRRGGNLRARIDRTPVTQTPTEVSGGVVANAFNDGFNYGYFIHAVAPEKGYRARESGTDLEFLQKSRDEKEPQIKSLIENAIEQELRRTGWL
jgi:hypothetical protein